MKIAIAGAGYVGLSNAVLLSQKNTVIVYDISPERVRMINDRVPPIADSELEEFFRSDKIRLSATDDKNTAFKTADYIIVSTPTNYDDNTNCFDTSSVESIIEYVSSVNKTGIIVIKSTIPVGFTRAMREKYNNDNILFSPEFLREGKAVYDNLYPSRIVVSVSPHEENNNAAHNFAQLLCEGAKKQDIPVLYTQANEAEAIKLFSNTYLALRIGFFNELDTFAEIRGLNTKQIIEGISYDPRIGNYYNNPSFGYGGYCLPKDTKQLLNNYSDVPQNLIRSVVDSNITRKSHIAKSIMKKGQSCSGKNNITVGIYRLIMKTNSDNFRQSAVIGVINELRLLGAEIIIYEPNIKASDFCGCRVENNFDSFAQLSDVIASNRYSDELASYKDKLYTRDIYYRD